MGLRSKDPKRHKELRDLIGEPGKVDEVALSDEELKNRLGYFQELSGIPNVVEDYNRQKWVQDVAPAILRTVRDFDIPINGAGAEAAAAYILNSGIANNFNPQVLAELISDSAGGMQSKKFEALKQVGAQLQAGYYPRINEYYGPVSESTDDYSADIKRLNEMVGLRTNRAQAQADVDQLVSSLPGELARGREELFGSLLQPTAQYFEDVVAPEVQQGLNARGLLYSGDLESELNRAGGELQGSLESAYLDQQAADDAFFRDAAYQQTFMKEIQAGNDVTAQVANQRQQATQAQQMSFQRTQAQLARQFQSVLQQKQQNRQYEAQQAQYRMQQNANKANPWQMVGQAVGTIGGAIIGNAVAPGIGGYIGAGAGGQFGGYGGSVIPNRMNS